LKLQWTNLYPTLCSTRFLPHNEHKEKQYQGGTIDPRAELRQALEVEEGNTKHRKQPNAREESLPLDITERITVCCTKEHKYTNTYQDDGYSEHNEIKVAYLPSFKHLKTPQS